MMINDDVFGTFKRFVEGGKKTPTTIALVTVGGVEVVQFVVSDGMFPEDEVLSRTALEIWRAIRKCRPGDIRLRMKSRTGREWFFETVKDDIDRNGFSEVLTRMTETFLDRASSLKLPEEEKT